MEERLMAVREYFGAALRCLLTILLAFPATPLFSDEQQAVTSTRDASISQAAPTVNNGTATTMSTHTAQNANQRSLVRFDLTTTGLNSNTALKTSTLNLVPTTPPFTGRNQEVHRITGTTDWTETGVTWNTRNGSVAWATPGGDFDPTATDSQSSGTTAGTAVSFNVLTDSTSSNIPQGWINGTIPNYGLLVKDQLEDGATWSFTRQITVTVGANAPLNGYNGYSAQITGFNTAALVTAGKMRSDCNDLRIARFAANVWTQRDRQVINCNTTSTTIWFKMQADVAANGTDTSYSLFYGNANATAPPANLSNVYLAYDNFDSDTVGSAPAGWTVQGGGPWTVAADVGTNQVLRESNATANNRNLIYMNSVANERDVFVQVDVRMSTVAGSESTGCPVGRVGGTTTANMNAYRSCLQFVTVGANPNQRVSQLAYWNAGAFTSLAQPLYAWTDNTFYTVAGAFIGSPATLRSYVNGVLQNSITGDTNVTTSGSVGIFVYDGDPVNYDFDNYLARRYTEPEPVAAVAAESANALSPFYGTRENIVANQPALNLRYLRDVTLSAPTLGISEITLNWTFPSGSTSSNYDGVLFAKRAGSVAPTFAPSDGTAYAVGAQPIAGQFIDANTSSFSTVSMLDENGDNSIILPGTQYTCKAYTHDATAIPGAATSAAPHYSLGNTATQTNTTVTGGGANKDWSYKTSATTLAAPALDPGNIVVSGGNDNTVHAMSASNGQRNYQPGGTSGVTGGTIQGRSSLIAAGDTSNPTCKNVCAVAYVAAGDGVVYAFRTDTGAPLWKTAVLTTGAGSGFQAAAAVQVKSFANVGYTNAFDLVVVATRNAGSTTNNEVFGLNGNTGATVWTFNPGNMDIVNATPYIDYINNFVWVASRSNGGTTQPSLWKISTNSSGAAAAASTFNLNDIDQPPTQNWDNKVIYVLANNGRLWVVRTDINNCSNRSGALGVTPVGFPVPIETAAVNDDVLFATTTGVSKVHVAYNAATCAAPTFTVSPGGWANPAITNPSSLIFTSFPQVESMYVASSDGHLYKINATSGANMANRVINLGATIGDPSFDTVLQRFYVGDTSGRVYSFDLF